MANAIVPLTTADNLQTQIKNLYDARELALEELRILDGQFHDVVSKAVSDWAAAVVANDAVDPVGAKTVFDNLTKQKDGFESQKQAIVKLQHLADTRINEFKQSASQIVAAVLQGEIAALVDAHKKQETEEADTEHRLKMLRKELSDLETGRGAKASKG